MRLTLHHGHNVGVAPLTQFDMDLAFGGRDPYKIYSKKIDKPPLDHLLLERIPSSNIIQVKFDDGTHRVMMYTGKPESQRDFVKLGIPANLVEEIMTHLWNFNIAMVRVNQAPVPVK